MKKIVHLILTSFFLILPLSAFSGPEIEIKKIASGVWVHTSYYVYPSGVTFPSNGLIVQNDQGVILIDTAWGELATVELIEKIRAEIGLPITSAIVTHSHADRLAGVDVLKSTGIPVYSHPLTQQYAVEYGLPVPDKVLESLSLAGSMVDLGNIEVLYPGPGHTEDNLMVWLPQSNILFGGCAIRAKGATSVGNTAHSNINSWLQVMKHINDQYQSAKIVIPGHGEEGGFSLVSNTLKLVSEVAE